MTTKDGIPKKIYLVIGDDVDLSVTKFDDLEHEFVCWSENKNFNNDIEYINKEYSDKKTKELMDEIDELKSNVSMWRSKAIQLKIVKKEQSNCIHNIVETNSGFLAHCSKCLIDMS